MPEGTHLDVVYHTDPEILEVIYKNNSEAAVDEYVEVLLGYLDQLRQKNALNRPMHMIVDISKSGMFPLIYGTTTVSKIIPRLKDIPVIYFAYITDSPQDRFVIRRLTTFDSARKQDIRKVFRSEEHHAAMEWLISNTST